MSGGRVGYKCLSISNREYQQESRSFLSHVLQINVQIKGEIAMKATDGMKQMATLKSLRNRHLRNRGNPAYSTRPERQTLIRWGIVSSTERHTDV